MVQNLQSRDGANAPLAQRPCGIDPAEARATRTKYAGGGDAVVTVNDVWLCLEDIQAELKQRSRTLQQALDVLRGA